MTTIEQIETAIRQLPPAELARLVDRIRDLDQECWDRELERDIAAGNLDHLADEALAEHRAGLTKPI